MKPRVRFWSELRAWGISGRLGNWNDNDKNSSNLERQQASQEEQSRRMFRFFGGVMQGMQRH